MNFTCPERFANWTEETIRENAANLDWRLLARWQNIDAFLPTIQNDDSIFWAIVVAHQKLSTPSILRIWNMGIEHANLIRFQDLRNISLQLTCSESRLFNKHQKFAPWFSDEYLFLHRHEIDWRRQKNLADYFKIRFCQHVKFEANFKGCAHYQHKKYYFLHPVPPNQTISLFWRSLQVLPQMAPFPVHLASWPFVEKMLRLDILNFACIDKYWNNIPNWYLWKWCTLGGDLIDALGARLVATDWTLISRHQNLAPQFIESHTHLVDWREICAHQFIDENFVTRNLDRIDFAALGANFRFEASPEFVARHWSRLVDTDIYKTNLQIIPQNLLEAAAATCDLAREQVGQEYFLRHFLSGGELIIRPLCPDAQTKYLGWINQVEYLRQFPQPLCWYEANCLRLILAPAIYENVSEEVGKFLLAQDLSRGQINFVRLWPAANVDIYRPLFGKMYDLMKNQRVDAKFVADHFVPQRHWRAIEQNVNLSVQFKRRIYEDHVQKRFF